ncbi:MAG: adenylate/guanylate cyclase domain-containing protein [Alphaproteobacteria bacterium]|jgi:adenylate cyclase|nr:adenylate/guanylate cyclase domain-containing protein [Alphaproteobacteria bacterium]MDP6814279.1 adenylate/guanylate cyclase domain-containing protein [Alphaproteobacteria bacterium]
MAQERVTRRLAAILVADVAGYSRLMEADEEATLTLLWAARKDIVDPAIAEHGGRIVKHTGDGFLAEFSTATAAVRCAVEMQQAMAASHSGASEDRRFAFRIGINLGEITVDEDDIYGDGVNIAARIEQLADPGGISISGSVFEQVRKKLDLGFDDMGEQQVKNIAEPVRCYRVLLDQPTAIDEPLPLPDRPSIVVLPFDNLSGDPEQAFFADGMTEDVITGLSRFRWLFVIARTSAYTFQGRAVNVKQIAHDLGVRYVLEGSVRKGGDKVRVTAQLIDATTGSHIWAESYDRLLEGIFEVQDEIKDAIVAAIAPEIDEAERERARRERPENLDAWALYQRGLAASSLITEDGFTSAMELFDRASELDPNFAPAFAMAAGVRLQFVRYFPVNDNTVLIKQAQAKAKKAMELDPRDPVCLLADARVHSYFGRHDVAISKIEEAVALNPNDAMAHYRLGVEMFHAGKPEEVIPHIDRAIRLSPRDANLGAFHYARAEGLIGLERYEECVEWARRSAHGPNPRFWVFAILAIALAKLGRESEARAAMDGLYAIVPDFSLSFARRVLSDFDQEKLGQILDQLREVGVPE